MKTILCPTDFSDQSRKAMTYAARMAQVMDASVHLMHAMHVPVVDAYAPAPTLENMMVDEQLLCEKRITNLAEELSRDFKIRVTTTTEFGLATDVVTSTEKKHSIDLVVISTHGATNAIDQWLGTTASQIVAKSLAPTIVIPRDAEFEGFSRVGYATDFTHDSDSTVHAFAEIMKPFKSQIFVVHVSSEYASDDEIESIMKHFEDASDPITIKGEDVANELNAFIWDNGINLLAMKRHKRSWFDNLFHKSITKQMIYHSTVPLLIFN
ncbi:MAG: hypothetical protein GC181_12260 [Bacteroidetes bacterium]|nr:hypothetical protein [Bacteroidota bacterium]